MSVGLTETQKSKIHHFIEKIRGEVEESTAPDSKKEKLFDILGQLAKEVSKARTRYERFADLARSLAGLSGDIEREGCLLYTSPSPRDRQKSRMPSSA